MTRPIKYRWLALKFTTMSETYPVGIEKALFYFILCCYGIFFFLNSNDHTKKKIITLEWGLSQHKFEACFKSDYYFFFFPPSFSWLYFLFLLGSISNYIFKDCDNRVCRFQISDVIKCNWIWGLEESLVASVVSLVQILILITTAIVI